MNKLKFVVQQSGNGHVLLAVTGHHHEAAGMFDSKPMGKLELWHLTDQMSAIPIGTEIEVEWPTPGKK